MRARQYLRTQVDGVPRESLPRFPAEAHLASLLSSSRPVVERSICAAALRETEDQVRLPGGKRAREAPLTQMTPAAAFGRDCAARSSGCSREPV